MDLNSLFGTTQKRVYPLSTRKNTPSSLYLKHHTAMPEYPSTDKEGCLHIINLQNYLGEIDVHQLHGDVSGHD
jgi:hypothetical protein